MKRRFFLLAACALLLISRASGAPYPLGSVAAKFAYTPSRVVADPARARVYITDTTSNSVVVIDTTTLKVVATVGTGSRPVDMAVSPDGNTLYVANNGSTLSAISLLDLNTLAVRGTFSLANAPLALAAGQDGRLYVSASADGFASAIYQLDSTTGAVQTTFNTGYYDNNLLTISPDLNTLYVANNTSEPGDLKSFDVSTAVPAAARVHSFFSTFPPELIVSHNGKYLCLPSYPSATYLYSTADITTYYGSFTSTEGYGAGPLAFSPDDSLVYETNSSGNVDVFSTTTFTELDHAPLPGSNGSGYSGTVRQVVIDNTGSYLFIATSDNGSPATGQLLVLTTGAGTLTPPSVLPVITSSTSANGTQGTAFTYQITASGTPTSFSATGLPDGLSVDTTTGLISGTPTTNGYSYVTLGATNASGTATAYLTLNIAYSAPSYLPSITTSSLSNGVIGQAYTAQVVATNSPYSYGAFGLPTGLSINANTGLISGTPTITGTYTVNLSAYNAYGTGTTTVSLTVVSALPVITSGTAAAGQIGAPFTYRIVAMNSPTSFAASNLPTGLSINVTSGLISGTPTVSGTFHPVLSATNTGGTATSNLTLTVAALPVPVIAAATTATATQGQPFAFQVAASNHPTSFAASGLPTGLSINTVTGLISGTPLELGTYSVGLSGTNSGGTGTAALTLTVAPELLVVTLTATTPRATVGSGEPGVFTVSLSKAQDHNVVVHLLIKGTAVNGTDYVLISTTKKIKAGKTSKPIKIIPQGDLGGVDKKVVTLSLVPGDGYTVGTVRKVKVNLVNP